MNGNANKSPIVVAILISNKNRIFLFLLAQYEISNSTQTIASNIAM